MRSTRALQTGLLLIVALLATGPLGATAADTGGKEGAKPEAKAPAKTAAKPTLIFFINPAGRPCQMQNQILNESRAKWEPLVTLRYARTDLAADRDLFYHYGIRSLPSLIVVDGDGKELHRFPPGIQQAETVLSGIRGKPER